MRLLWSGDWSIYDGRDFWVTVVGLHSNNPDDVLGWCIQQGFALVAVEGNNGNRTALPHRFHGGCTIGRAERGGGNRSESSSPRMRGAGDADASRGDGWRTDP